MVTTHSRVTLLALLAVAGIVVLLATAASPAAADEHTLEEAEDYTEEANYTVDLPFTSDHYPGDQNTENGSIQYFAAGEQAMHEVGAEDGAFMSHVIVSADFIDYSACSTDNTYVFGFDRGNDNEGTQVDEDLIDRMKETDFRDDGLTVEFYDWGDIAGDPPYGAPEDAIVAEQGSYSTGGPCLTMTDEPGWYQLQGFINGTAADNGPDQQPSEDAHEAGILAQSNYVYVCDCDSREEAEEQLGPAPDENGEPTPTPEPETDDDGEATDDATGDDGEATPAPAGDAAPGDDETDPDAPDDGGEPDADDAEAGDDTETGDDDAVDPAATDDIDGTPTPGDGTGFGPLAAVLALLGGTLLARRHR